MSFTSSTRFEMLNKSNYDTWKIQVEALLIKNDTWSYVSGEKPKPQVTGEGEARAVTEEEQKKWIAADRKAKSDLILAMNASELRQIRRPARKATLLKQLTQHKMREDDDVREHVARFMDTVDKLQGMNIEINGDLLSIMLLYSLPSSFENFRCAIESRDSLPNVENLKVKIVEENDARNQKLDGSSTGGVMFSKQFSRDSNSSKDNYKKQDEKSSKPKITYKCNYCGKRGHKAADCFKKKREENQKAGLVHEAYFSGKTNNKWCLDSGCTSHICNDKELFINSEKAQCQLKLANDYSRWTQTHLIRKKSEVASKFREYKNFVETQLERKIKAVQSDNGKEYCNTEMDKFFRDSGIQRRLTTVYSPQQNGLAERKNRTLVEAARCMLLESGLPASFWGEAIMTANHVRNRCISKSIDGDIPYKRWTGKSPDVSHVQIFGCKAYVLDKSTNRGKFDSKTVEGIFVGYSDYPKGYRVWIPSEQKIRISRDVKFFEEFESNEYEDIISSETLNGRFKLSDVLGNTDPSGRVDIDICGGENSLEETKAPTVNMQEIPLMQDFEEDEITVDRSNIEPTSEEDPRYEKIDFVMAASEIPFSEAIHGADKDEWKDAILSEIKSLVINDTWDVVDKPDHAKVVGCRTVLRNKYAADGTLDRHTEVFMEKPALLQEMLQRIIDEEEDDHTLVKKARVMLRDLQGENKICRLRKALYELRQAGRQWNYEIDKPMKRAGLVPTNADPCVYVDKNTRTFVLIYVDDILIISGNQERERQIKDFLSKTFRIKDFGLAKYCLGIQIEQNENEICLSQAGYIREILKRYRMEDLGTRPDVSHTVSVLSQFSNCYRKKHCTAAKRVLRYLKGTIDKKLIYRKNQDNLTGYVDADWANCEIDRRSYTGSTFILSGAAFSWESRKQRTVALSSTEAEYMALSDASKEADFLIGYLKELGFQSLANVVVFNDNQGAGKLTENSVYHAKSKHIDVRYHFIRDAVKKHPIKILYLPTEKMIADVLTKALPKENHDRCILGLGLQSDNTSAVT
ncbi:hypothetical protein GEV33_006188 [Tenebrio molitor]|uniref:Uncharacterized protein n=1 Tax=Tenebrio molitor TaxID=7067 RepID=A0A8J6HN45_TENMO|nr:hypothetical protein GEV33_006188 [Tenebrio molitor]